MSAYYLHSAQFLDRHLERVNAGGAAEQPGCVGHEFEPDI